jgi:hypothetical protein
LQERIEFDPSFIKANGPVREARFVRNPDGTPDGGVHSIFTIAGRTERGNCNLAQPDFAHELAMNNVIFRIPTPVFGLGLIEQIPTPPSSSIKASNATTKQSLGIRGRTNIVQAGNTVTGQPNLNGNEGRSRASDGRPRTNPSFCSRARLTTSKWESPTSYSRPSVTRPRRCQFCDNTERRN